MSRRDTAYLGVAAVLLPAFMTSLSTYASRASAAFRAAAAAGDAFRCR